MNANIVILYSSSLSTSRAFYAGIGFSILDMDNGFKFKSGEVTFEVYDQYQVEFPLASGVPRGAATYFLVEVDDVDSKYQQLESRGGVDIRSRPNTFAWGRREFAVKDPDGYVWVFYHTVS